MAHVVLASSGLLFGWMALAPIAEAQTIGSFSPTSGGPGSSVTISGSGFPTSTAAMVAFVYDDLSGSGATFELQSASATQLAGVLGPSQGLFTGEVVLWTGQRYTLPPQLYKGIAATYLVQRAEWFVPSHSVAAPGTYSVTGTSPTLQAARMGNKIVVHVEDPDGPEQGIGLDILVGGGGGGGGDEQPPGDGGSARRITITVEWIEAQASLTAADLATDLAMVLEATYGPLGLHTVAVGSDLELTWDGAPILDFGLAVGHFIPGP